MTAVLRAPRDAAAPDLFRLSMRQLASGVSIVTHGSGDERTGMTVTSVSSLSADPPTLVVCVNRSASLYPRLAKGERLGVSVLAAGHSEQADIFAGRAGLNGAERFREGNWSLTPGGVSTLADAVAAFECEVEEAIERGTHVIVIARVRHAAAPASCGALLYWRGDYDQVGWAAEEISRAVGVTPRVETAAPPRLRALESH